MPDILATDHGTERSFAVRTLLAAPLLLAEADPDGFATVARHRAWLTGWFDETCGWALSVDVPGRSARLTKRSPHPDPTRPARRTRGAKLPFDRRRYELLARLCGELVTHQVTTVGILATALAGEAAGAFDSSLQRERAAFVDALRLLATWGVVRFEGGELDGYVDDRAGNALVLADGARLHRLLAPPTALSRIPVGDAGEAADQLAAEPRYGAAPDEDDDLDRPGDERRRRRARHSLARRLLDDPAVHLDELDDDERAYLASSSGRRWLRDRLADAGFVLEERAEGLLAVDPEAIATDERFPAPAGTVRQVALLLVDELVSGPEAARIPSERTMGELTAAVGRLLGRHPTWAREYQGDDGAARLAAGAVDVLAAFRLVVAGDGVVRPRPALARYAVARAPGALL